jgi:hypothetical protein
MKEAYIRSTRPATFRVKRLSVNAIKPKGRLQSGKAPTEGKPSYGGASCNYAICRAVAKFQSGQDIEPEHDDGDFPLSRRVGSQFEPRNVGRAARDGVHVPWCARE